MILLGWYRSVRWPIIVRGVPVSFDEEDGGDFEQYKDARVDGLFTNGIGKMVLIR
ncbi:MAG: hypothetical protein R2792_18250 [Saprospiraceae bacterium]